MGRASARLVARILGSEPSDSSFGWLVPPGHAHYCRNVRGQVAEAGSSFWSAFFAVEGFRQAEQGSRLHCHAVLVSVGGVIEMKKLVALR